MTRVTTRLLVDALRRRTEDEGGAATVLTRGDANSGTIILVIVGRDGDERLMERLPRLSGELAWKPAGPDGREARLDYLARRRQVDPDLWILELANLDRPFELLDSLTGAA